MAIPIALQLYSVRQDCAADLLGTIAKVAKMGYAGVEFAGFFDHSAADVRKCLDDNGLVCPSTHTGLAALTDETLEATAEYHLAIGATWVIVPWLPNEMHDTVDACLKSSEMLTGLVEKLGKFGLKTGFHAHGQDMVPINGGECGYDIIAANTPKEFAMQYDTANGMGGGADPVEPILKWPGRGPSIHLKEWSGEHGAKVIGEGLVPWQKVFEACETVAGTQWYVVEHESYEGMTPIEAVEKCLQNLRAMGK